jgi:hypothetical protein
MGRPGARLGGRGEELELTRDLVKFVNFGYSFKCWSNWLTFVKFVNFDQICFTAYHFGKHLFNTV